MVGQDQEAALYRLLAALKREGATITRERMGSLRFRVDKTPGPLWLTLREGAIFVGEKGDQKLDDSAVSEILKPTKAREKQIK